MKVKHQSRQPRSAARQAQRGHADSVAEPSSMCTEEWREATPAKHRGTRVSTLGALSVSSTGSSTTPIPQAGIRVPRSETCPNGHGFVARGRHRRSVEVSQRCGGKRRQVEGSVHGRGHPS